MAQTFLDRVTAYIDRHNLLSDGVRVLVGVSGGPDSMVCLDVMRRLGYDVQAFHVNYGLREGADADEALVRSWCAEQSIPLNVVSLDARARAKRRDESLQEAARELRYKRMAAWAAQVGAEAVVVGHHRDDQAETLLLNLLRGSGPEGLAGMPPSRSLQLKHSIDLVRPLLGVSRTQVEAYADEMGVPWRDDPSNRDPSYDRATVRTKVLPLLEAHFEGASANIARAASLMRGYVDATFTPAMEERLARCYEACGAGGGLAIDSLRDEPIVWRHRLILAALERTLPAAPQTSAVAQEIHALLDAQVGRRVEVKGGTVWRERRGLRFLPKEEEPEEVFPPLPVPWGEDMPLPGGVLRIDPLGELPRSLDTGTPNEVYVDAERLVDPLAVRTWKEGDRIQPLGLDGTKLVSDLLTDAKVPPHRRSGVYVLSTDEHMAWVVGHRLDHRMRVRPTTNEVARLLWRPDEKTSDDCNSA